METPYIPDKWRTLTLEFADEYVENKRKKKETSNTKNPLIMKKSVKKIKVTTRTISTQTDNYTCIKNTNKCNIL
tara:strand:- start:517 stop:738 length:222 start_codon:yes stop_codon:yes gene_type:complete